MPREYVVYQLAELLCIPDDNIRSNGDSEPQIINPDLPQAMAKRTKPRKPIHHICDFSRGVLNARLPLDIQHLLRDHKYGVWVFEVSVFGYWSEIRILCWRIFGISMKVVRLRGLNLLGL